MTTEDEDHAEDYFNGANHDDCVDKKLNRSADAKSDVYAIGDIIINLT